MLIRKFVKDDIKQVLEICREVRDHHIAILNGYFKEQDDDVEKMFFLNSLENENIVALVAEEQGVIAGYLLAEKREAPHLVETKVAHISNFGVKKDMRNQGIGRRLMDAFYTICQQYHIDEIKLGVFCKNEQACKFYQKYGFEEYERRMHIRVQKPGT